MSNELEETAVVDVESNNRKFTVVGAILGAIAGSRRGKVATVIGGAAGGALGYFAGKKLGASADPMEPSTTGEPVVVTVADDETEEESDATNEVEDDK